MSAAHHHEHAHAPQAGGCGSGSCGCSGGGGGDAAAIAAALAEHEQPVPATQALVNGIALHAPGEQLHPEALKERAWSELLRQEAMRLGLLPQKNVLQHPELTLEEQEVLASMLEREVSYPKPGEEEARRHFEANRSRFTEGARARLRHILFAVTDGVPVSLLAARAEQALLELKNPAVDPARFGALAAELSNCPSGAEGGELGWVTPHELAPELATDLFHPSAGDPPMGLRPRLVHSRYGLHIIEVLEREPGRPVDFEAVRERIAMDLEQQSRARALHQYIRVLAGRATLEGIELEAAGGPLVQ